MTGVRWWDRSDQSSSNHRRKCAYVPTGGARAEGVLEHVGRMGHQRASVEEVRRGNDGGGPGEDDMRHMSSYRTSARTSPQLASLKSNQES
jgi:hypothetical protein